MNSLRVTAPLLGAWLAREKVGLGVACCPSCARLVAVAREARLVEGSRVNRARAK